MTRVLLIDDDPELLEILGEWLSGRGHLVRASRDAEGAVEAVVEFAPDLVLLDGVLRGTTGQELAVELERRAPVRVVFLSGLPRDELPADRLVLQKPIDLDALERVLRLPVPQVPEAIQPR